jgi:glycosyltransferase involved in cell wall biosynthesis
MSVPPARAPIVSWVRKPPEPVELGGPGEEESGRPLVSICLPVLNGERLVARAVESALAQDYPNIEVVVVDDASTDGTVELLLDAFGDRIRLYGNRVRAGQGTTTNATLALARGRFIKFLHHDDVLHPDCVSRMVEMLQRHPSAGMVFSRRRVELASDDEAARAWLERYGNVHLGFEDLRELNVAPRLFDQLLANGLHDNWIGEPVCVMVRRDCLEQVGGFSLKVRGGVDLGVWLRFAACFDIAFIDRELVTYRRSATSHIGKERDRGEHWLDRLWMLEGLLALPDIARGYPRLVEFRARERRMARRATARTMLGFRNPHVRLARWFEYERWRLRSIARPPRVIGPSQQRTSDLVAIKPRLAGTPGASH